MDFEQIRERVFNRMQQTNFCRKLSQVERQRLDLGHHEDVWHVGTELSLPAGEVRSVILYLCFPYEFPLLIPSIHLSKSDYQRLGYLPHVNAKGSVCVFDSETTVVNPDAPDAPYQIVRQCLHNAKRLVEREYSNKVTADFQREILAYWEDRYHRKDAVATGLSLLANTPDIELGHQVFCFHLKQPMAGFELILHQGGSDADLFREFITKQNYSFDEDQVYYLGELSELKPPFYWTNRDVIQLVKTHFPDQISSYNQHLNRGKPPITLFSTVVNGELILLGWAHKSVQHRNGFRAINSQAAAIHSFAQPDLVLRLKFESLSQHRLSLRTDGQIADKRFSLAIAGLGSIGSNLVGQLRGFPVNEYRLIDPEVLKVENINRHLLGLMYVGRAKADAIQDYLTKQNPLQPVAVRSDTIVKVISQEPDFFKGLDALFIAIGKNTIEQYVVTNQQSRRINVPLFLFWIEPYAIAGHMVYVPVGSTINYSALFPNSYYQYNAVAVSEYQKHENRLLLKEAGCQTTYLPYSQELVTLFLARLLPEVRRLLHQPSANTLAFTWMGNIAAIRQRTLSLSDFAADYQEGDLIITQL